jgi:hypothetical protein
MAELLVSYTVPTRSGSGDLYYAQALGDVADDGLWEGWLEFTRAGDDVVVRTGRETEQPKREDVVYWAQGLTEVYLEGALARALSPEPVAVEPAVDEVVRVPSAPKPRITRVPAPLAGRAILDPFQAYAEGENLLRSQLRALSHDHLQNIAEGYHFVGPNEREWVRTAADSVLVERIVTSVRARALGNSSAQRSGETRA